MRHRLGVPHQVRNDVLAKVTAGAGCRGVASQLIQQEAGAKYVNAHRDQRGIGFVWHARRIGGFFQEFDDATTFVNRHHAEAARRFAGYFQAGNRHIGGLVAMLLQHQLVVHLVDMVARQDDHIFGVVALNDIDVLEYRVGGAFVPLRFGYALRRRKYVETFVTFRPQKVPALLQVADQRMGLVLCGDYNAANAGESVYWRVQNR